MFGHALFHKRIPTFKALDSLSFKIPSGEVVGIIGPNGAGKSTLLKILSGVSKSTAGNVQIEGTSVSILELSTGFNPHQSGRENIHRRLAIHGYSPEFIREKEPQIIEFSELSEVIDKKVRTYSTGMAARLAFSIVTAMDAEIFYIDEILVVGDEHFQGKCFRKMKEICESGRTVLIASHSINYVERLCNRAIWIENGKIVMDGPAHDVGMAYYGRNASEYEKTLPKEYGRIEDVKVTATNEELVFRIVIERLKPAPDLHVQIAVHDNYLGILSLLLNSARDGAPPIPAGTGPIMVNARIRRLAGLTNGLVGVGLIRGNGYLPGSIVEDTWGWDNGKIVYFIMPHVSETNDYVGISPSWKRCT